MKTFCCLFSLYILVLSCLPCGDMNEHGISDAKNGFSQTHHHNHHESSESCSPFCSCACCGTSVVFGFQYPVLVSASLPSFFPLRKKIIIKNDALASNFYANIWQPPKI